MPNLFGGRLDSEGKANMVERPSLMTGRLLLMGCRLTHTCYGSTQQLQQAGTQQQNHPPGQMGIKPQCILQVSTKCTVGYSMLHR